MAITTIFNKTLNTAAEHLHFADGWYSWPTPTNPSATDDLHIQIAPRPAAISPTDSRFTFAADVTFPPGYFSQERHFVVAAGVSGGDPFNSSGSSAWGGHAVGRLYYPGKFTGVAGALNGQDGSNATTTHEERNGLSGIPNAHQWKLPSGSLVEGQKYRFVVDRIQRGSTVTCRLRVYASTWSADSGELPFIYAAGSFTNRDVEHVALADVSRNGQAGPLISRVAAWWSSANEPVINP